VSRKPPVISGHQLVRALLQGGWRFVRQKGSHVRLQRGYRHVSVPLHETLKRGTLAGILKDAGMTVDELRRLLS